MAIDPTTSTSYSDPLYDRLESFMRYLGRHWIVCLLVVVLVISGCFVVRSALAHNPTAASAMALEKARNSGDPKDMSALLGREDVLDEYKARAANLLVQEHLRNKDYPQAKEIAQRGLQFAKTVEHQELTAVHLINLATVAHEIGDYAEALAGYDQVQSMASQHKLPVHALQAIQGRILTLLRQADLAESQHLTKQAWQLRRDAMEELQYCADLTVPGTEAIARQARFDLLDLRYRHPDLASDEPPVDGAPPEEVSHFVAPPVERLPDAAPDVTPPANPTTTEAASE